MLQDTGIVLAIIAFALYAVISIFDADEWKCHSDTGLHGYNVCEVSR